MIVAKLVLLSHTGSVYPSVRLLLHTPHIAWLE